MPDLLLEFFSEEIPARMQAKAAEDLRALVTGRLVDAGLVYDGAKAFATPRRLALSVQGIPQRQPDLKEEKKGPRVGAPPGAIQGFLKSAGLSSLDQARVERDPKKGDFYVALIEKPGRPAIDVLAEILPVIARTFPWPKSMRWGAASARPGSLSWVRPLQSIVATFGPETQDPDVVAFALDGVAASDHTHGHRFLAPRRFKVRRLSDYMAALEKHKVVLDAERRQNMILADARTLAFAKGYALVEDEGLLAEVAGLVEWPVVLMGAFDASFLGIPEEVIRATIRANQKCFVLRDEGNGKLVNKFILVSNIEASDGGRAVVGGNERVIRARLSDAKFFYETDLKAWREVPLDARLKTFDGIVFHDKLGSQGARIRRIESLAATLAPLVGADAVKVRRAARLCKADLLTEVVGEFPELQGMMGADYARATGEDEAVARACEEHYRPKGPDDLVPGDPVSVAVALADKIDILVGFWAINEKPTGSKDPFALRRAALGVLRILLAARLPLVLRHVFENHAKTAFDRDDKALIDDLAAFFEDRLVVQLRDQKVRNGVVSAVLEAASLVAGQELLAIVDRVEALGKFLDTDDGRNLLAGYKRAANILAIEEKRDKTTYGGAADGGLYRQAEEWALAKAIETARQEASAALAREDVTAAMAAMAALRPPVDAFFDKVTVNADDKDVRANRLRLLGEIRAVTGVVADFSRIEG